MLRTILPVAMIAPLLAGCAETGGETSYSTPGWTRGWCAALDWRRQGAEDAARYPDADRRLAALERACGIHIRVPRDEYLEGYASAAD